jgi:hypothetical protein
MNQPRGTSRMNEKGSDPMDSQNDPTEEGNVAETLLKKVLKEPPELERSLLPKVQARIRQQTHGRYFGRKRRAYKDPTVLLLASAMLLLALGAAFLGLFDALFP